jgi:hypothetical protein
VARNVSHNWGTIPKEVYAEFSRDRSTNVTYNRIKKKKIKPVTSLSYVREVANRASKKSKIPIHITTNLAGTKHSDAICITDSHKKSIHQEVRIHPIVQYYKKRHIKDIIGHELDHVAADNRRYNSKGNKIRK